jgi:predicted RNA polymerase sigma factor
VAVACGAMLVCASAQEQQMVRNKVKIEGLNPFITDGFSFLDNRLMAIL